MDPEKSSNSSFEDLSNLNENEDTKTSIHNEKNTTENFDLKPEKSVESNSDENKKINDEEIIKQEESSEDSVIDIVGNGQLTKKVFFFINTICWHIFIKFFIFSFK